MRQLLTERQIEVLRLVALGKSNREIAARLCIERASVSVYLNQILQRLGLQHRTQLALYALKTGIVRLAEIELPDSMPRVETISAAQCFAELGCLYGQRTDSNFLRDEKGKGQWKDV